MATPKKSPAQRAKKAGVSRSARAKLTFPVGRVARMLRQYSGRVSSSTATYLTAVLDYLTTEVVEQAAKYVHEKKVKKSTISPRILTLALNGDDALKGLLKNVVLSHGGVCPERVESRKDRRRAKKHAATPSA